MNSGFEEKGGGIEEERLVAILEGVSAGDVTPESASEVLLANGVDPEQLSGFLDHEDPLASSLLSFMGYERPVEHDQSPTDPHVPFWAEEEAVRTPLFQPARRRVAGAVMVTLLAMGVIAQSRSDSGSTQESAWFNDIELAETTTTKPPVPTTTTAAPTTTTVAPVIIEDVELLEDLPPHLQPREEIVDEPIAVIEASITEEEEEDAAPATSTSTTTTSTTTTSTSTTTTTTEAPASSTSTAGPTTTASPTTTSAPPTTSPPPPPTTAAPTTTVAPPTTTARPFNPQDCDRPPHLMLPGQEEYCDSLPPHLRP